MRSDYLGSFYYFFLEAKHFLFEGDSYFGAS